ncbi:hypothetical protein LJ655_26795 [Paraburkholderia sp. MMS20-SJTN17]|uniref:Uncharacterized protein n=1 Tax=Paraburkholderia translucens TaxID=2886945 RepID=A0ABS8KKX4_9BURK|nr:hypothetical protein [Paraburkholderia sp. MMS20-SJTN17]MCC8405420.1 hypothetical protein [Paraburkholderia sp. MMS20-SJTN17]
MTSATDLLITYLLINKFGGFQPPPNLADPSRRVHLCGVAKRKFCRSKSIGTDKADSVPSLRPAGADPAHTVAALIFADHAHGVDGWANKCPHIVKHQFCAFTALEITALSILVQTGQNAPPLRIEV